MLKIIGILSALSITTNVFSSEYEVIITDELTGDVLVESCANDLELKDVVNYAQGLEAESVKFSVKRLISIDPIVMKVGGEGGTD